MTRPGHTLQRTPDVPHATPGHPARARALRPPARQRCTPAGAPNGHVPSSVVLVLLPPSETKHPGGGGAPLDLAALTAPELTPLREQLLEAVVSLSADVPAARA